MSLASDKLNKLVRETFSYKGWLFECQKGCIWGVAEYESNQRSLLPGATPVDHIPDAFFGSNFVRIHHLTSRDSVSLSSAQELESSSGIDRECQYISHRDCPGCDWSLEISPIAAANGMALDFSGTEFCIPSTLGFVPTLLKVKHAKTWQDRRDADRERFDVTDEIKEIQARYDWTCVSKYWGSVFHSSNSKSSTCCLNNSSGHRQFSCTSLTICHPSSPSDIPQTLLRDTSIPIIWLQKCDIYSDDLSDSGMNTTQVKIRVMPDFWFLLYCQQIRVDEVAFRQIEELTWMEAAYETLMDRAIQARNRDSQEPPIAGFEFLKKPEDIILRISKKHAL